MVGGREGGREGASVQKRKSNLKGEKGMTRTMCSFHPRLLSKFRAPKNSCSPMLQVVLGDDGGCKHKSKILSLKRHGHKSHRQATSASHTHAPQPLLMLYGLRVPAWPCLVASPRLTRLRQRSNSGAASNEHIP